MSDSLLKKRKKKMRDRERSKKRALDLSPVIVNARPALSLSSFREICDFCMEPPKPGRRKVYGRAATYVDANRLDHLRYLVELALKLYNDKKLKSFKLVKVYKINRAGAAYYGLTFRAREDGSEECPVFRGVVHLVGGAKALFCEIKDDDVITLPTHNDDYVSSERACEREDCPPLRTMQRGASTVDGFDRFTMETQPPVQISDTSREDNPIGGCYKKQVESSKNYVSWNRDMDKHLAKVLIDQMAQGNKCDGTEICTWKPQALRAAVTHLNSKLHLSLTKKNIKNRLKAWKKYYSVVIDVQKQSGFCWDEDRKMISVTSEEYSSWKKYVESHPDAKGLQNKVIENWSNIVLLCGRDRATGLGAETFEEGANAMGEEDETEVNSAQERSLPSDSVDSMSNKRKKAKKDALFEVVASFQEFVASKMEERPSGIEIHEVVSSITGLTSTERFKAVKKLMDGNVEWFRLLKTLPDEEKREWVYCLVNS